MVTRKGDVIASAMDVSIHSGPGWDHSFFSSPYQSHRDFSAVDICQGKAFGEAAASPVKGEVLNVSRFESPTPTGKSLPEYLILIGDGEYAARIMHVEPCVEKGDRVRVGDEIGRFIRNGFFTYWVDAIMHVEIRSTRDYIRASGGIQLEPLMVGGSSPADGLCPEENPGQEVECRVVSASPRNITLSPEKPVRLNVEGAPALPDGALSLDYAGLYGRFDQGSGVYLNGIQIGTVNLPGRYMSTFRTIPPGVSAMDSQFAGISFADGGSRIRLLPEKPMESWPKKGEKINVSIREPDK